MKVVRETELFFMRRMIEQVRSPLWFFMGLINPLLYLVLFAPLLGGIPNVGRDGVADAFVPGLLALFALNSGTGIAWIVNNERTIGVIERFRVSPVSRLSLLLGNVLKDVVMFLITSLIVTVVSNFIGFHIHVLGLAVLFILLCLLTAIVSAACSGLGLIARDIGTIAAVVTGLQLPITLLSGVLLPISFGPTWLQVIAHFNPLYYVVEASRVLASGTLWNIKVFWAFTIMVLLLVVTISWATNIYRKVIS